jgi:hypothetical protein
MAIPENMKASMSAAAISVCSSGSSVIPGTGIQNSRPAPQPSVARSTAASVAITTP